MTLAVRKNLLRAAAAAGILFLLVWSWQGMGFESASLTRLWKNLRETASDLWPPDWSVLPDAWLKLLETLRIAILGTAIGVAGALPVGFLAARSSALPRWFSTVIKTFLNIVRAIPAFIYAVLIAGLIGLGAFAGALAVGMGSFVMLSKLFAETLETLHPGPIEAVKAAGGSPLQVFSFGMLPQAMPQFVSHTLYAWELNIGTATITGIVGAGGMGAELRNLIGKFMWQQVAVYILLLIGMVLFADGLSFVIRKRMA